MQSPSQNCAYCGDSHHGLIHCNSNELNRLVRDLCVIAGRNDTILFSQWLQQCTLESLFAIVSKLTLWDTKEYFANNSPQYIRTELVMMIQTYFEQFVDTIFDQDIGESIYRDLNQHKKRALNFGRVSYIRQIITHHPDQTVRDLHMLNPSAELSAFPDLLLNSYWYHTSYMSQLQLPHPITPHQENIRQQISDNMGSSFQYTRPRNVIRSNTGYTHHNSNTTYIPITVSLKKSTKEEECSICYESVAPTKIVQYDCLHSYCMNCAINVYKKHHHSCAMCRKPTSALYFQNNGEFVYGKQSILLQGDEVTEL
jgi:hypothetical protein